ncbi:ATP-binding protein [Nocardia sp. BMG51109]|uniref:ATP-binding protein n=1 Tax=Nocardia sp. BMG51109 TaxID=1056816 RepID=UPI0006842DE6|nr:DUF87 domain-containing protein [Nocardia sp. BMG51109]
MSVTEDELRALAAVRFNWALTPDDVWSDTPFHVDGMHVEVDREVSGGLRDAVASERPSPIGLVLKGQRGAGKTHLLGWVRRKAQQESGYFFLVDLEQAGDFWTGVLLSVRRDLLRPNAVGESQLTVLLQRLAQKAGMSPEQSAAITGAARPSKKDLDLFVAAVRKIDPLVAQECKEALRALVLYGADDDGLSTLGGDYLGSLNELSPGERRGWGLRPKPVSPQRIVRSVSWLLALTGPTVIAIDQLDAIADQSGRHADPDPTRLSLTDAALGLMTLRESTRRTMTLIACITPTWGLIRDTVFATVADRFREVGTLGRIADPAIARTMTAKRLAVPYAEAGFHPPYPTWPIAERAFDGIANQFTPRALLQRVDAHIHHCVVTGRVSELERLDAEREQLDGTMAAQDLSPIDREFAELKEHSDVRSTLDPAHEDRIMPKLLAAALTAWKIEQEDSGAEWTVDPSPGTKSPALHARLRRTLDEETEAQENWAFRAIAHPNPRAAQTKLRNARLESGLRPGGTQHLVILRNSKWPGGKTTGEQVAALKEAGGLDLPVTDDDLRTFSALETLLRHKPSGLEAWLITRQPATKTELLDGILGSMAREPSVALDEPTEPEDPEEADPSCVGVGETLSGEIPMQIALETFPRHITIIGASGSGKTVLVRRLIEECALRGVSAIVLDPNNDLARLGDAWSELPKGWRSGDARLADRYLADTEVLVWTPGWQGGRPLCFQPLPDFASVRGDEDALLGAVDVSLGLLAARAKITGKTKKASWSLAVLREALTHYARGGNRRLDGFIRLLADLPDGVSTIDHAPALAAELATSLQAARIIDPLFGDTDEPVDLGTLLTPAHGKKARVSVISFVGLPTEEQRQGFVNQLQGELFTWIKNNPANDRKPLSALFVMDEAQTLAPAGPSTPSTQSTVRLAGQARKYGLGLIFATQAPKGLNNQIPGNSATLFIGKLIAPVQVGAAREIAQALGGTLDHVGALQVGQFYASTESSPFERIRTPNCLSHHPKNPLTPREVIQQAKNGTAPDE